MDQIIKILFQIQIGDVIANFAYKKFNKKNVNFEFFFIKNFGGKQAVIS